jgi:hypothetical protein
VVTHASRWSYRSATNALPSARRSNRKSSEGKQLPAEIRAIRTRPRSDALAYVSAPILLTAPIGDAPVILVMTSGVLCYP